MIILPKYNYIYTCCCKEIREDQEINIKIQTKPIHK